MSTKIVNVSDRQKILWHLKVKSSAWKGVRYLSMISEKVSFIKWNDILIFFFSYQHLVALELDLRLNYKCFSVIFLVKRVTVVVSKT